jgi:hypothetical protein
MAYVIYGTRDAASCRAPSRPVPWFSLAEAVPSRDPKPFHLYVIYGTSFALIPDIRATTTLPANEVNNEHQ